MANVAGLIPFKAKPGQGDQVARLISAARPHVEKEPGTLTWLVLRSNADPDMVFLVDVFADAASRDAHMAGAAAKQIMDTVPAHLREPLEVHPSDLVIRKG